MKTKFNKKALRAFAAKVKTPSIVRRLFAEVESEIKTVAFFGIRRIDEMLLTTALFDEQGCFAVIFTRKSGDAIAYGLENGNFYKGKYIDSIYYGNDVAYINTGDILRFFNETENENPLSAWRRKVFSFKERQKDLKKKVKSKENCAIFKDLSPIPSNFKSWCRRDLSRIIFDTADRKHGHCQYCDQDIELAEDLVQGHSYKCHHCHHKFEALSNNGHAWRRQRGYALLSEMNGVPVVRHFVFRIYKRRDVDFYEYERDILIGNAEDGYSYYDNYIRTRIGRYEYWRDYKKCPNWYGTGDPTIYWEDEPLYPYSSFSLFSDKISKIAKYECHNEYRWEEALSNCTKNLEIAQILNAAGYSKALSYGAYSHCISTQKTHTVISYGRNPKEILEVDGNIAKLFKDKQYGFTELQYYDLFRKTKESRSPLAFSKSLIFAVRLQYENVYEKYIKLLLKFNLTVAQTYKYFSGHFDQRAFNHWYDYIQNYYNAAKMADKMPIGKSWIFPPLKDIEKKHDEAYKWYQAEYKIKKDKEREEKNRQLAQFVSGLSSLDNYSINGMIATLPHSYGDFVIEGTNQKNCVGGHGYFDAMAAAESIIVFLRTKKDESYCTCEFSLRGDKIRLVQCRLKKNADPPEKVRQAATKYGMLLEKQLMLNRSAA